MSKKEFSNQIQFNWDSQGNSVSEITHSYWAGFFDGEGCVNISENPKTKQVHLRIMIVNTNEETMKLLAFYYGGKVYGKIKKRGWKKVYCFQLQGIYAIEFLKKIYPYVFIKKKQIETAFEFWDFMNLPLSVRLECYKPSHKGNPPRYRRKRWTIDMEQRFKKNLNLLNKRGDYGK